MKKITYLVFTLFFSYPAFSQQYSIKNIQIVSNNEKNEGFIFRGSQPFKESHYEQLKKMNIKNVIIFKLENTYEVFDEKLKLIEYGFEPENIFHIPMKWKNFKNFTEACEQTKLALEILIKSYINKERTYFHCTAGQDRTGYLDGLFQILINQKNSIEEVFQNRLCQFGYSSADSKKPMAISKAIDQELTVYFQQIAQKIQALKEIGQSIEDLNCQSDTQENIKLVPMSCLNIKSN